MSKFYSLFKSKIKKYEIKAYFKSHNNTEANNSHLNSLPQSWVSHNPTAYKKCLITMFNLSIQ